MNMRRSDVMQAIASVVSFATVRAARMGANNSVELQIQEHADDPGKDWCEWWGDPGLSTLPLPGSEALFVDLNGERIVIAVKERRWQLSQAPGQTSLRAMSNGTGGPTGGLIRLQSDGSVVVSGQQVTLGDTSPYTGGPVRTGSPVVLTPLLHDWLKALNDALIAIANPKPPVPPPGVPGADAINILTGVLTTMLKAFEVGATKVTAN